MEQRQLITAEDIRIREGRPEPVKQDMRKKKMTPEHSAKMKAARDAYWAQHRALKQIIPDKSPKPVLDALKGTIYEPAEEQEVEVIKSMAGRPRKENELTKAREHVLRKIYHKKDKLIDAHIDSATGLYYTSADGSHVYTQKPNVAASEYLLNQLIGKAKENIEVTSVNLMVDL